MTRAGAFCDSESQGQGQGESQGQDQGEIRCQDVLALVPCCDIHTFGMHENLDVAFLDACGRVVASKRGIPPRKRVRSSGACVVLERFSREDAPWPQVGDVLHLSVELVPVRQNGAFRDRIKADFADGCVVCSVKQYEKKDDDENMPSV